MKVDVDVGVGVVKWRGEKEDLIVCLVVGRNGVGGKWCDCLCLGPE